MHPTLVLFPLFASLLLCHVAHGTSPADGDCKPAICGSLTIKYPFWLSNYQPSYCGHPSFELVCDYVGAPVLKGSYIRVLRISYANTSLVAAHSLLAMKADGACRASVFNVSSNLELGLFKITPSNRELRFLSNCSGTQPHGSVPVTNCREKNDTFAYLGGSYDRDQPPAMPGSCAFSLLPVLGSEAAVMTAANYSQLIKDGFLLEWEAVGNCSACSESGGMCRYDNSTTGFACLCSDGKLHGPTCADTKTSGMKMILIVLMAVTASLLFPCVCVSMRHRERQKIRFLLCLKKSSNTPRNIQELLRKHGSLAPKIYKYSELKKITSYLSNRLGEGGYGMVFKGRLHDGRLVAVKFLHDSKGNGEDFVNEVMSIGRTSHVNIVGLLGFCLEGSKRALIYEYMPNGSLDQYIYSENPKTTLGWERLYEIAIGIARGLEYLHEGCNTRIIHFDIKPHNILLDQEFCPKIADFGMAKLCRPKESKLSMAGTRGTIGFIAPEVCSRSFGTISTKSDVYSYGMMLLEMVGGRKNVKAIVEKSSEEYFPDWIYDHFAQDDGLQACEVTSETEEIARKMTLIGLWCIQVMPVQRPMISKVLDMFERSINNLDMPPKQNFSPILEDSSQHLKVEGPSSSSTGPEQVLSERLEVEEISLINSEILQRLPTI